MSTSYHLEEGSKELNKIVNATAHHRLAKQMVSKLCRPVITHGETYPGDILPVIAPDQNGTGRVFPMVWGMTGKQGLIHELGIDLLERTRNPVLLNAWERHRCLIPASWYYEWEHLHPSISYDSYGDQTPEKERRFSSASMINEGTPDGSEFIGDRYMLQTRGSAVTMLAGIYRIEEVDEMKFPHFMILTQEATSDLVFLHTRMPVIFDARDTGLLQSWLDPSAMPPWDEERVLEKAVTDMVYEKRPWKGYKTASRRAMAQGAV